MIKLNPHEPKENWRKLGGGGGDDEEKKRKWINKKYLIAKPLAARLPSSSSDSRHIDTRRTSNRFIDIY